LRFVLSRYCSVLLLHRRSEINSLNTEVWRLRVLSTEVIYREFRNQKTVVLNKIEQMVLAVQFYELQDTTDCTLYSNH